MSTDFPKQFRIIATLKAPEGATPEDVKRVVRQKLFALNIESVTEITSEVDYEQLESSLSDQEAPKGG